MSEYRHPNLDQLVTNAQLRVEQNQRQIQDFAARIEAQARQVIDRNQPQIQEAQKAAQDAYYTYILPWGVDLETNVLPTLSQLAGPFDRLRLCNSPTYPDTTYASKLLSQAQTNPDIYRQIAQQQLRIAAEFNIAPQLPELTRPRQSKFFLQPASPLPLIHTFGEPGGPNSYASGLAHKDRESTYSITEPDEIITALHPVAILGLAQAILTGEASQKIYQWAQSRI